MDKAHLNLLARLGTALYQQDNLQQADLDAMYDEIEALVAEVERLRHEVADQQMMLGEHQMDTMHAYDEGGYAERAAVVAFLRETLATSETASASDDLDYAIDIIERGKHRREEGL